MRIGPPIQQRLIRTRQAAEYLCMSEWKLRRLIQDGLLPHLHDGEGSPFLLDIRDLDAYVEKHKHHGTDDPIFRPLPVHESSTSKLKGDDYAASSGNRKPVSSERQRGLVDQIPSQRKIVS
jgi:excisionase family DNA binding protein